MRFASAEIRDLGKSWFMVSLAFAIAMFGYPWQSGFWVGILFVGITAGAGFLLHELAHKYMAQRYGCQAEYRSFDQMLWLAVALSFFGFVFAAPGAVFIRGYHISKSQNGKISIAGPLTNFALALLFMALIPISHPILAEIFTYGKGINAMVGIFNLIPFGPFDGKKVFDWNKLAWAGALVIGALLMFWPVG